jgi:glutathione S-transferase
MRAMAGPSITVHHLENSRSQRVLWLLEELEVPYEIVRYARDPRTLLAPTSLREVHPLGKSPVVAVGDEVLAESGAILEELVERFGAGRLGPPADAVARRRYRYWMHYAEGSLMPLLVMKLVFRRIGRAKMPFFARPIARGITAKVQDRWLDPQLRRHLDFVDVELGRSTWFAGDEIPPRGGHATRRHRRSLPPSPLRARAADPRAPRLPARARARRPLRTRLAPHQERDIDQWSISRECSPKGLSKRGRAHGSQDLSSPCDIDWFSCAGLGVQRLRPR